MEMSFVKEKIDNGIRICREEAVWLYNKASHEDLQILASTVKARFHELKKPSYRIMAIINFTNICTALCDFCAFYKLPREKGGYLLTLDQIFSKIDSALDKGAKMIGFNSGFHPGLKILDYCQYFEKVHSKYGDVVFYDMTVAEFMYACKNSKLSYQKGAALLKEAGTKWITGGGAEVLDENFRKRHSSRKFTVEEYFQAQKVVLDSGLNSTATMVIGFDETLEERMNHLESLRSFQDRNYVKIPSFLCWTYKPYNTPLGGNEILSEEYYRWLSICRIYLDNFVHMRSSVLSQNQNAMEALSYGADDFDIPLEDEVLEKAGAFIQQDWKEILSFCQKLGYAPKESKHLPVMESYR
jgi:cyclic dehypoxanthinyl futalosine synthase